MEKPELPTGEVCLSGEWMWERIYMNSLDTEDEFVAFLRMPAEERAERAGVLREFTLARAGLAR